VAVVTPHKAADAIAYLDAVGVQCVSQLIRSIPRLFEGLPVGAICLRRDYFDSWV
jgi:hypothetical protein